MERPLIIGERIMFANGDVPINCLFAIRVKGKINLERLENALALLQRKHGLLRATIDINSNHPRFIFHETLKDIPIRIVERSSDHQWIEESKREWKDLFPFETGPFARLVWIKSESISELILVCPHVVCDGTTFVTLMRELLVLLDNPSYDLGSSESFISLEKLLPEVDWNKKNLKYKAIAPIVGLIFKTVSLFRKKNNGKNYMITWSLPEKETTTLVKECKSRNVSVHSALCCATLSAFRKVKGNQSQEKVISPTDIRRYIPYLKKDTMFAFAPTLDLSLKKHESFNFWDQCHELYEDMKEKLSKMDIPNMLRKGEYFHGIVKGMINFIKTNPGSHDITISNMGKLDIPASFNTFEVETIWSPTVAFPWKNPNTIIISTYKGKMNFSFVSNEVFLSHLDAENIKTKMMETLHLQLASSMTLA